MVIAEYENSMKPKYSIFANARLGTTTNPTVATQLAEFGQKLNEGVKNIEIGALSSQTFETIPDEHLESIKQLTKITGSEVSMHAPLIDPSGFPSGEGQNRWSETERNHAEQQIKTILERAYKLGKNGNVPVVLHASGMASQEYAKDITEVAGYTEDKKLIEKPYAKGIRMMTAVNQETGEVIPLEWEKKVSLSQGGRETIWTPEKRLESLSHTQWDKTKLDILSKQKELGEIKAMMEGKMHQNAVMEKRGLKEEAYAEQFQRNMTDIRLMGSHIKNISSELNSGIDEAYNKFVKFGSKETNKKELANFKALHEEYNEQAEKEQKLREDYSQKLKSARTEKKQAELINEFYQKQAELNYKTGKLGANLVSSIKSVDMFRPVNDFSKDKMSETISNVTKDTFAKFGEKAPMIALENFQPGSAMSRAKDLKEGVEMARKKFVEKVMADKSLKEKHHLTKEKAEKIAEKLIGATWDMGHINMLRRAGYSDAELAKLLKKEAKEIAPVTKHLHITDNFGFSDSHLPPGMGNVPIREMMEEFEKAQFAGRSIIEAGGFINAYKASPHPEALSYFDSPLYSTGDGPHWAKMRNAYSPYFETFTEFPQQHFSLYGSSFATVPKSLGGQTSSENSRFSETPNS